MIEQGFKRKLTAVLSADAVGYSRLMAEDEASTVKTIATYREIMSSLIKQHRGRVVDSPGDNVLAEFSSVVDAVQCAVALQNEFQTRNAELAENRRMEFRIGINLGDVIDEEDRIYGDGVNIAARLESMADPGGICVSKTAFDQIETKLPLGYEYLGEQSVKNIPKPVGAYRVLMKPDAAGKVIGENRFLGRFSRKTAIASIIFLLMVAGGLVGWNIYLQQSKKVEPASVEKMAFPLPEKPSIAVLPFDNLSGDPGQDYIADGISENIITALSYIPQMFVIARNSSFTYKGKPVKVQKVSEELGVRYILEGSVLKSEDKVRITAQLIDALTGGHIWSERFDRNFKDLFGLLDEITQAITVALQVKLTDGEQARLWFGSTRNFEAWGYVVKGMGIFYRFGKENMAKSRELFEKAIEIDRNYSHAVTMLGWTHKIDAEFGWSDSKTGSLKRAFELANKSVAMNDKSPIVHSLLSLIYLIQGQHDKAIEEGRKAIAFGPNDAEAHSLFGEALFWSGMFEDAVEMYEKAIRLHPHTPLYMLGHTIYAYYWVGRYDEALAMADQLIDRSTKVGYDGGLWFGYQGSAIAHIRLGQESEAREDIAKYLKVWPGYNLDHYRTTLHYKDQAHTEQILADLRRAGAPDHPPSK
ncbi:MAG: adenylate/guanylate cyclase domain-containing protein [Nitrospinales bacterium]